MRNALEAALEAKGIQPADFSELMIRLLDRGVLCRNESRKEAELYDRYLQVADLVEDYLAVLHIRLLHEPRFHSLRLFPPGAEVPGLIDTDDDFNTGLRDRLSQQEVMVILVLRAEYDKALREGQIDEEGEAQLPLEELNLACRNLLGRSLPEGVTERRALFRRLRQLRLLRSAGDDSFEDGESWVIIRPGITGMVTDEVLSRLTSQSSSVADKADMTDASTAEGQGVYTEDTD